MDFDRSYNQACFATLAVWYVMKHCPQAITDDFKSRIVLPKLGKAYESVQKRASRDKEPTQKNDVLQWFHLSCLILICSQPFGTVSDGQDGFIASGLEQHDVIRTQQKFEKYVARLKTNHNDIYSIEHEELDRLVLLGEELAFEALKTDHTASLAAARVTQTRARIAERKRTTRFNPGPKSSKGSRLTSNGPWELLCLNHLNHLLVTDESNIRASRDRLFEFMMADYSFMTSWDRSDSDMVGKWWDLEPTAVVCGALLDLKLEGKLKSAISEAAMEDLTRSIHDPLNSSPTQDRNTTALEGSSQELPIKEILLQMKQANEQASRDHLVQMRQLLAQDEMGVSLALRFFDWMACKPSFPIFHPNSWSNSLDDTPEVYKVQQTKHVPLRKDILRYLESRGRPDVVTNSEFTLTNIVEKIPAEDMQFLSIFDLRLKSGFVISSKELSVNGTTSLSSDDIIGRRAPIVGSQASRSKKASNSYSSNQLDLYRSRLFKVLNDSLVDMGVKYRIFFLEKCSPSLIGSFIYLWHPDALDTIDSYFGASSRFSDARERQMWTTTITISHWSIQPTSLSKEHLHRFKEHRRKGNFPPNSDSEIGVVEERSSSLVITGDSSGHLWICSVWSSLTDVESIALPIRTLPSVLQRFIHQQACGRCLAFLILLGHFCEKLAGDYELTLSRLDGIVGLGEEVLLEGLEWGTSEAVDKLKKMLWGLEALRVFDDRLSASISQIQKAQETMERTIRGEASQQHVDLLEEYNNVIEEFEKRYGMLSDMQVRTQLKIRQVTGLRDGISAVTNVEDSQTALRDSKTTIKQGNNIRILTYITIAYLPLGFVTGLFSVGHGTFMDNAGNALFAILVVVFVVGTYGLALSLESIIDQWSRFKKQKKKINKRRNNPIAQTKESEARDVNSSAVHEENRQSKRLPLGILGSCFGLRKTDELTDGNSEEKISRFA